MVDGKWIQDLKATTPVADAARHVLKARLEVVRNYLPLAAHHADQDIEHVHQLRVSTRRARAALDIFSCCLTARQFKSARQQLRNVRRAAGEARDWDVFIVSLFDWARQQSGRNRRGLDCLIGYAAARREVAQTQLQQFGEDFLFTFDRFLAETVAAVRPPDDVNVRTLLDLARPRFTGLLQQLDDNADSQHDDFKHLHSVRVLGKRLRYAMEVFVDCFPATFRDELYPAVEQMQEILGSLNDSYVACQRLEAICARLQAAVPVEWKRLRPTFARLLAHHQARLPEERDRFQDWWARWRHTGSRSEFYALFDDQTNALPPTSSTPNGLDAIPVLPCSYPTAGMNAPPQQKCTDPRRTEASGQ